jgi:PAS domain S-box-containing protein
MPDANCEQLLEENRLLKAENDQLKQVNNQLSKSEKIYSAMFQHAGFSIVMLDADSRELILFNKQAHESLGYCAEEFRNASLKKISRDAPIGGLPRDEKIMESNRSQTFKVVHRTKSDEIRHRLISTVAVEIDGKRYYQDIWSDITDLVEMEQHLEKRVAERTLELQQQSENLQEMNRALNALLKKRETDKAFLEENLVKNIKELVVPYIQLLNQGNPSERQRRLFKIIEANLEDVSSGFSNKLSAKLIDLTPAEIRVANLVKAGQTTKEIASHLLLLGRTVEAHRSNIRKKLGLDPNRVSLKTYLSSL